MKELGFTPSEYQKQIFDFVQHGNGNAVIKACAGSGKTSTLLMCMKLIPNNKRCLFIAFNKSIVEELANKIGQQPNCDIRTIHSLGYLMIQRNFNKTIEIDEYKYKTYIKDNISKLTSISDDIKLTVKQIDDYVDNIAKLIDFSRFNLAQCVREIKEVAYTYDIPVSFDECEVALQCMEWGKQHTETVDFTDMVWLPYELSLLPQGLQYDWIFIDEAQDLSKMAVELFKRCFKRGTRFVASGDNDQSIYLFAGASSTAFEELNEIAHTQLFTLPITYRCSRKVTAYANALVPYIRPCDNAEEGEVKDNCHIYEIKCGDMVLSRSNAPLMQLYVKLLRQHVKCFIKGKDIGVNLIALINEIATDKLNANLKEDGLFVRLFEKMFNIRDLLMEKHNIDVYEATMSVTVMDLYDKISTLLILADYCQDKQDLIRQIENIFQDEDDGICLSTIHKAKGLEATNVYIVCHSTMPSKSATHEWEKIQEKNLQYVAYTRAKRKLGFISEQEIRPLRSSIGSDKFLEDISNIEHIISSITHKECVQAVQNLNYLKFKTKNFDDIITDDIDNLKVTDLSDEEYLQKELEKITK